MSADPVGTAPAKNGHLLKAELGDRVTMVARTLADTLANRDANP